MTTGGDCSGLNAAILRIVRGAALRGHKVLGVLDGTDGLTETPPRIMELNENTPPIEYLRISGSFLKNGDVAAENFQTAARMNKHKEFQNKMKKAIADLNLDAMIIIGGNGSLSLAHKNREIYSGIQLVCIPKTIDMDIPLTEKTIGFDTAVQSLTAFCDQLMLTARSHHRWFVVQTMGRDTGHLALNAGIACAADAILIPEIKFSGATLAAHLKKQKRDFGIVLVSEGIKLRGHSGQAAEMIARELKKHGIAVRTAFPEHTQRAGDTSASDRILATRFADAALGAIDNNETYVMTALRNGAIKTIPLEEMFNAGEILNDPNIPGAMVSNSYVEMTDPLLFTAANMGVYVGEIKA